MKEFKSDLIISAIKSWNIEEIKRLKSKYHPKLAELDSFRDKDEIPNYIGDLNALRNVEIFNIIANPELSMKYYKVVYEIMLQHKWHEDTSVIYAEPWQKFEALLRVLNLWEEDSNVI